MEARVIGIEQLEEKTFASFGYIVKAPEARPNIDTAYERYWHDYIKPGDFSDALLVSYFETKKMEPVCASLECIKNSDEAYINLGSSRMVLFAAPPDENGRCSEGNICAFLIPPGVSIVIYRGIWHFAPIPVDGVNPFLLILAKSNILLDVAGNARVNAEEITVHELDRRVEARI